jgi:hypothetical protein
MGSPDSVSRRVSRSQLSGTVPRWASAGALPSRCSSACAPPTGTSNSVNLPPRGAAKPRQAIRCCRGCLVPQAASAAAGTAVRPPASIR